MTELEQQLQNYAAMVERLNKENAALSERLRLAIESAERREGKVFALQDVIDRLLDRLTDS